MRFVDEVQDQTSTDPEKDVPNLRLIHTKYGFDIKLERKDPYGFVFVGWPKGSPPSELGGAYSDFDKARLAVANYLANNTFNKAVDEPVQIEKAVYKKRYREANG